MNTAENSIRGKVQKTLDAAEKLNPQINAFLKIERDYALQRLSQVESASEDLPLRGLPIAVKDNICTKFSQTSCGSNVLGDYNPPYNATAVERLEKAGAVIIGKTNKRIWTNLRWVRQTKIRRSAQFAIPGIWSGFPAVQAAARLRL
jgi:Asp-tRNA(Asn)/Glu-tRNA(Gln) amidotransferase A subunit family amidase